MTNITRCERVKHETQIIRNHHAMLKNGVQAVPLMKTYAVFETNADLARIDVVHAGISRDTAESYMYREFLEHNHLKDFYVECNSEIVAYMFSERTKQLRGECQG